jgi:hypothetical protein
MSYTYLLAMLLIAVLATPFESRFCPRPQSSVDMVCAFSWTHKVSNESQFGDMSAVLVWGVARQVAQQPGSALQYSGFN